MECFGNFFDEEWHRLSTMFHGDEGSDHLASQGLMSSQYDIGVNFEISDLFMQSSDESSNSDSFVVDDELVNVSYNVNPNFYQFFAQENIGSSGASNGTASLSYPCHESFPLYHSSIVPSPSNDVCDQSNEFCMMDEINNLSLPIQVFSDGSLYVRQGVATENAGMVNSLVRDKETPLKRKHEVADAIDDEVNNEKTNKNPKKRIRVARENNKTKKNVQPKKNQKMDDTEVGNNNNNRERNGQSSSSCRSNNDDLNESQDVDATNPNGKTRASRGTATDPQSLYARKRRERINERLRILQNLVPNGTKVDISTMLEEAVEYVKFLKLQIQLLSSDDKWMYAPIAYNGMDMGLYQNIAGTL